MANKQKKINNQITNRTQRETFMHDSNKHYRRIYTSKPKIYV